MSTILQESFRRLAIRSPVKCSNCKRTLATSAVKNQQKSSTSNLYQSFQGSLGAKEQRKSSPFAQRTQAATATTTTAASTATATDSLQSQSAEQDQYDIAIASARESGRRAAVDKRAQELANLERTYTREDLERQIQRQWRVGDVYAPHDLSGIEMAKWKKVRRKPRPKFDALDVLGINPLHYYKNFSIMHEYMTETGRIKPISETGLRPVNQRRMAKAIRRAVGIGLIPSTHKHPELLKLRSGRE